MKSVLEGKGILPLEYTHLDPVGAFHFQHDAANLCFPQSVLPPLLSSSASEHGGFEASQAFDPACKWPVKNQKNQHLRGNFQIMFTNISI